VYVFQKWTTLIVETSSVAPEINIWIIVGAVLGALFFLAIVIFILYKVKQSHLQKVSRL